MSSLDREAMEKDRAEQVLRLADLLANDPMRFVEIIVDRLERIYFVMNAMQSHMGDAAKYIDLSPISEADIEATRRVLHPILAARGLLPSLASGESESSDG